MSRDYESDMRAALESAPVLCAPHLLLLLKQDAKTMEWKELIRIQLENIECLRGNLAAYLRKQDYRSSDNPSDEENRAWRQAINVLAGKRDIF